MNISVACRVRPGEGQLSVSVHENSVCLDDQAPFAFDQVFDEWTSQEEVYNQVAAPVLDDALRGMNGTIFCYGQTGSGKTHTVEGNAKAPGLIPRLSHSIFEQASQLPMTDVSISVSFIEVYMEKLQDLLLPSNKPDVRESLTGGVHVAGACIKQVSSTHELLQCLRLGQSNRATAATKMNERSSRSHSVFTMMVRGCDAATGLNLCGILHIVDLAGSESQKRIGSTGQTLEESKYINQSLLGLGQVINALSSGSAHVPYRDSKLTRILQDSLGGNARTSLIVNVSPELCNKFETLATLRFGQRAKLVVNVPKVNTEGVDVDKLKMLLEERDGEIALLRRRVAELEMERSATSGFENQTLARKQQASWQALHKAWRAGCRHPDRNFDEPKGWLSLNSAGIYTIILAVVMSVVLVDAIWGGPSRSRSLQQLREGMDAWKAHLDASVLVRSQCEHFVSKTQWLPISVTATLGRACRCLHPMTLKTITLYEVSLEHYNAAIKLASKYVSMLIAAAFAPILMLKLPMLKVLCCALVKSCCVGRWMCKATVAGYVLLGSSAKALLVQIRCLCRARQRSRLNAKSKVSSQSPKRHWVASLAGA